MKFLAVWAIASTSATVFFMLPLAPAQAQGIVPAANGTDTQVTPNGTDHAITGGTTSADNQNLFHQFSEFNVLTGESATFFTNPAILNILSGVTGSNPSLIDGLLQVSGSNANLFLINPNGILLGPNSALNLQGSFTAVTADQVNFASGAFGAVGSSDYAALVGDPQSFSFSLDNPASVVNAGDLAVTAGESVMLIGGQVLNVGTITAPGGEIIISAIAGGNLVRIVQNGSLLNLEVETLVEGGTELTAFSPLSLPELLTGSDGAIAPVETVTVNPDGTVQLASGTLVNAESGAITAAGLLSVAAAQGGQVLFLGEDIALPEGLIDIGGTAIGGELVVYATDKLTLGIEVNAAGGGHALFDPPTFTVGPAESATIVTTLDGGDATVEASETITVDAAIDSSAQGNANILTFADEDADGVLTINLNELITLGDAQTLLGEGSLINVVATGSVQNGVDVAAPGATINIAAGTYQEGEQITLDQDITLNGAGKDLTILDGNKAHRVLEIAGGSTVSISDLAIENGFAFEGGGIYNDGGSTLTVSNSTVSGNVADFSGGGISNTLGSTLIVSNSTLSGNTAGITGGGGISNTLGSTLTVSDSTISGNRAENIIAGATEGGGILNDGGNTLTVTNSTVSGNVADLGGGILNGNGGDLTITNSTLSGNTATEDGGGIFNGGDLTITNSTLSGNTATEGGGGIYNSAFSDLLTIRNSTLAFNSAENGGGIFNDFDTDGTDIFEGTLILSSSLITGNAAESGANLLNNSSLFTSEGNNLFGSDDDAGVVGASLIDSDIIPSVPVDEILSDTLADNGGPTQTLALVEGSPAIDQGSGSGPDQRGFILTDDNRDIGAFEFGAELPMPVVDSPEPDVPKEIDDDQELSNPSPTDGPSNLPECVAGDCVPLTSPQPGSSAAPSEDTEVGYVQQFEEYLEVEAVPFDDLDSLERARNITGVTPALVYAQFVPPSADATVAQSPPAAIAAASAATKELIANDELGQQIVAQAEGQQPTGAIANEDILQLVLVTADNEPRRINTGATRSEVLAAVHQLQVELTDRTRRRLDTYLTPAQSLYGWLVSPLEAALAAEDIGHVSFVLDQGLRSLPLAALHDGNQFIIENYSVGLMPSLSLTDTRIGDIRNTQVLAMGAAEFTDQPPLPAVPVELAAIKSQWPSQAFLNDAFLPEAIVQERAIEEYAVVHLATHGQFVDGPLSESYIQFWDERLSLDELPQLQLGDPAIELLVLSACRTVLGGKEAELGFAGLAVKSGAKSAIAALWQVSDLETAGLMAELYTHLGQVTYKAEALRQAQLAMLRGEVTAQNDRLIWSGGSEPLPAEFSGLSFADTRHPYYWSAFTLVGNPW